MASAMTNTIPQPWHFLATIMAGPWAEISPKIRYRLSCAKVFMERSKFWLSA